MTVYPSLIYESTYASLTCVVTLPRNINVPTFMNISWTHNNQDLKQTFDERVSITETSNSSTVINQVTFNPIDNGDNSVFNDSGRYICKAMLQSNWSQHIPSESSDVVDITVNGKVL